MNIVSKTKIPTSLIGDTYIIGTKELKNLSVLFKKTVNDPMAFAKGKVKNAKINNKRIKINNGVIRNEIKGDKGDTSE